MSTEQNPSCPKCTLPVLPAFYFCPNCGKLLRPKPITLSPMKIIGICLLSFFLPPLGLFPALKYIKQPVHQTKLIGWVAISLTVIAYSISLYTFMTFMEKLSSTYGTLLQY